MTNRTRKWLRGGIEILIHGGASALVAGLISVQQSGGWFFASKQFWQIVVAQFAVSGLLRFFQFLSTHPLPEEETISLNPMAKDAVAPDEKKP